MRPDEIVRRGAIEDFVGTFHRFSLLPPDRPGLMNRVFDASNSKLHLNLRIRIRPNEAGVAKFEADVRPLFLSRETLEKRQAKSLVCLPILQLLVRDVRNTGPGIL